MRLGQERVSGEAAKLVNALRNAPKARGRWGEQQLRNVLESCGLAEHTDFAMEVSVADGEGGRLRPDAIVRVPGGKSLIIDAKVSLNAYQDAFGAVDEGERHIGLTAHAASMRAHINGLSAKAYWSQFDDTPEYVVMFVPGEHFLSAALEHDAGLWDSTAKFGRSINALPTGLATDHAADPGIGACLDIDVAGDHPADPYGAARLHDRRPPPCRTACRRD